MRQALAAGRQPAQRPLQGVGRDHGGVGGEQLADDPICRQTFRVLLGVDGLPGALGHGLQARRGWDEANGQQPLGGVEPRDPGSQKSAALGRRARVRAQEELPAGVREARPQGRRQRAAPRVARPCRAVGPLQQPPQLQAHGLAGPLGDLHREGARERQQRLPLEDQAAAERDVHRALGGMSSELRVLGVVLGGLAPGSPPVEGTQLRVCLLILLRLFVIVIVMFSCFMLCVVHVSIVLEGTRLRVLIARCSLVKTAGIRAGSRRARVREEEAQKAGGVDML